MKIWEVCTLYTASAMDLIQIDHKPNREELGELSEYINMLKNYIEHNGSQLFKSECKGAFEIKRYIKTRENETKENDFSGRLKNKLTPLKQVLTDMRNEFAEVYMIFP